MTRPSRAPLWRAIADALRADIAAGRRAPGARLPTEADLAARFAVNRHTVRRALAALAEEGLVRSRRGAGAFVAARPTDYRLGRRVRFRENLEAQGRIPHRKVLGLSSRAADAREAAALGLSEGDPVLAAEGVA
jgi:GntR family phosphonate transport system transcriptional regulator